MKNKQNKHLTLRRYDLSKRSANLRIEDIQRSSFNLPWAEFWYAETAVFVDEDGAQKVLKDRYGVHDNNKDCLVGLVRNRQHLWHTTFY